MVSEFVSEGLIQFFLENKTVKQFVKNNNQEESSNNEKR
jgi:hypothetical protein